MPRAISTSELIVALRDAHAFVCSGWSDPQHDTAARFQAFVWNRFGLMHHSRSHVAPVSFIETDSWQDAL